VQYARSSRTSRGHGRSDVPAGGYDTDTFADDLATLITTFGLDDLAVMSHSMGGGEVVRYLTSEAAWP
jgi:non-heme chloroperoxidase